MLCFSIVFLLTMKTHHSDLDYLKKVASLQQQALHVNPPAIRFRRTVPSTGADLKLETKKIKIKIDPDNDDSEELEVRAFMFEDGDAEQWIKWRIQLDELIRDIPLKTEQGKIKTAKALLKGAAREVFLTELVDVELDADSESADLDGHVVFEETVDRLGRRYFTTQHAYRRQRNYLRYHLFMMEMKFRDFKTELLRQNNYLRYFPIPDDRESCDPLPEDEIVEIIDRAKRIEWQRDLLSANIDPYSMSLDQYSQYLEKLEVKHEMDRAMRSKTEKRKASEEDEPRPHKRKFKGKNPPKNNRPTHGRSKECKHCKKWHPAPDDQCWALPQNADKRPNKAPAQTEKLYTASQMKEIVKAINRGKDKPGKKRQVSYQFTQDDNSSDEFAPTPVL